MIAGAPSLNRERSVTSLDSKLRFVAMTSLIVLAAKARAQCPGSWSQGFGAFELGVEGNTMLGYDDGTGNALYVGMASGGQVSGQWQPTSVLRWDGARALNPVGNIGDGGVEKLLALNDGSGLKLYAAGTFSTAGTAVGARLARWNGTSWATFGGGITGTAVNDLVLFDDGTGPAIYAGGDFTAVATLPAQGLAKWNGAAWTPVVSSLGVPAGAITASINALAVFDGGAGPRLYAAGRFTSINGVAAQNIASWNGTSWSPLGAGVGGLPSSFTTGVASASALLVHDDGNGPRLFVGGRFHLAGGAVANGIASWDGSSWHTLQSGMNGDVRGFELLPGPSGSQLVVGGWFTTAGGLATGGVALWNGASFVSIGATGRTCDTLHVFDAGNGPELYIVGVIGFGYTQYSVYGRELQKYDGTTWRVFQHGVDGPGPLMSLAVHDDGSGTALYAGGAFASAGAVATKAIARWNGATWSAVGGGLSNGVSAVASFDDGTGPALYASESIPSSPCPMFQVKRWNGTAWANAGQIFDCWVNDLRPIDLGAGSSLYAAGTFTVVGGTSIVGVARWTGGPWAPLGGGVYGATSNSGPNCLAGFDDGGGPALYVGGALATWSQNLPGIARWNGTTWSGVGGGLTTGTVAIPFVTSLAVHDDGSGPALYAAGGFSYAGGIPASNLARWNGSSWAPVGGGFASTVPNYSPNIQLESFDDGSGPRLYAAGNFETAGGILCNGTAVWDGTSWQPVGSGLMPFGLPMTTTATDLAAFDPGTGRQLMMCGSFQGVNGNRSVHIAALVPGRPTLAFAQPGGPGTGVVVTNTALTPGASVYNVFSLDSCPGLLGSGPYLGLCCNDPAFLLSQVVNPPGVVPFHYTAWAPSASFGPYGLPPGIGIQGVCFDFTGGALHCVSTVAQVVVQ
jgi:trimeric autotransporter adhesin